MSRYNEELSEELLYKVDRDVGNVRPSCIAERYDIEVKQEDIPYSTIGIHTRVGSRAFILVNDSDTQEMQEYVIALCLYYYLNGDSRILLRTGPADNDYSAAHFAYQLHLRSGGAFDIPDEIREMGRSRMN